MAHLMMPHKGQDQGSSVGRLGSFSRLPVLFGKGGRDRLLVCLAVNGSLRVRTLAEAIGSDPSRVIEMIKHLEQRGLVMTSRAPGYSYTAINVKLPVYESLLLLCCALDSICPAPRRSAQVPQRDEWTSTAHARLNEIFSSIPRSKVLLFVAKRGPVELNAIRKELGFRSLQTKQTVAHWEREGVFKITAVDGRKLVELDDQFPAAKPLLDLLHEITTRTPARDGEP